MFRCKQMSVDQWGPFQDAFIEVFTAFGGDKRLALFLEDDPDDVPELDTILITSFQSDLVERLSPGGWQDCPDARERRWNLLVGAAGAAEDLGLNAAG